MLVATRSTPRKINLVFQPVRVIFCQPASKAKPCIIFIASNKVGNKNAFVTWQPLHRFLQPHQASASFGSRPGQGSAKATKNVELSEKVPPARSPSSSMFLQAASCSPSPVPASHYKYDERTAPFDPVFFPILICKLSLSLVLFPIHPIINFLCPGHPGVPAEDGGGAARGGGGGGEHPP